MALRGNDKHTPNVPRFPSFCADLIGAGDGALAPTPAPWRPVDGRAAVGVVIVDFSTGRWQVWEKQESRVS